MRISLMVMTDDTTQFGVARDNFNEKSGLSHRDLHKLYQRARHDLTAKLKKLAEVQSQTSPVTERTDYL